MKTINFLIKVMLFIYALFILLYGVVIFLMKLENTINFQTEAQAQEARILQIFTSVPFIIVGIFIFTILIVNYLIKNNKLNCKTKLICLVTMLIVSIILLISTVFIKFYFNQYLINSMIVPCIFILIYLCFKIITTKKANVSHTNI